MDLELAENENLKELRLDVQFLDYDGRPAVFVIPRHGEVRATMRETLFFALTQSEKLRTLPVNQKLIADMVTRTLTNNKLKTMKVSLEAFEIVKFLVCDYHYPRITAAFLEEVNRPEEKIPPVEKKSGGKK